MHNVLMYAMVTVQGWGLNLHLYRHNNCVHIVTREGRHNGHLITGIDPICVCLYPAGRRLWVAYKGQGRKSHVMEMSYTPQSSAVTSPVTSALTSSVCSLTLKVNLPKIL